MGLRMREVCFCDVCGWEWIPEIDSPPKQCSRRSCRSREWNGKKAQPGRKAPVVVEQPTSKVVGVEQAKAKAEPETAQPVRIDRPGHDSATCRIYRCGMCGRS